MNRHARCLRGLLSSARVWGVSFLFLSAAGHAQETRWVTVGEYNRIKIAEALQAAGQAARGKREFNERIARARATFLANRRDKAAEKAFADLLQAKDHYYFAQMLAEGTSEYSRQRVRGMNALTGGALDEGIVAPAEPLFMMWVDKVRATLGAKGPREVLLLTDTARVDAAIRQHDDDYKRYRTARDTHEIERADLDERVNKARAALTAESKVKLDAQEVGTFNVSTDLQGKGPVPAALNQLAAGLGAAPVLRCRYGPNAIYNDGAPAYERFRFWQTTPAAIDDLINANTNGHLGELATRSALPACPATALAARTAAVRVEAPGVKLAAGDYTLEGVSAFGRSYQGRCSIAEAPEGHYVFECKGRSGTAGKGTVAGNLVTVDYELLGKIVYEVGSDGGLNGSWSGGNERLALVGPSAQAGRPPTAAPPDAPRGRDDRTSAVRAKPADRRCEQLRKRIEHYESRASSNEMKRLAQLQAQHDQQCGG